MTHVPPGAADADSLSRWRQRHAATCRASDARPTELTCRRMACCCASCRHQEAGLPARLPLRSHRLQLRRRDLCAARPKLWQLREETIPREPIKKNNPCAAKSTGMGLGSNASQTKCCSCQQLHQKHIMKAAALQPTSVLWQPLQRRRRRRRAAAERRCESLLDLQNTPSA